MWNQRRYQWSFSYYVTLKGIGLSCALNGSFTHWRYQHFIPSSFGRCWFTELHRSSKYFTQFIIQCLTIILVNISIIFSVIRGTVYFYCWLVFECKNAPQFLYPSNYWWAWAPSRGMLLWIKLLWMLMYESCIHEYFHLSRTHIPPNLFIFDLSHFSHCSTREVCDIVVICISLVTNDVHILIIYLLAICLSPFVCLLSIGLGYLSPHWIVKFLKYFKYIFAII